MRKFKKCILGLLTCSILVCTASINVSAYSENANSDIQEWSDEEFTVLIDFINSLKSQHPNMSNEDIIRLLDEVYRTRSSISDIWGALTDSEKKLVVKYPFSALKVNTAKNVALEQTELKFGNNGLGDRSDAFRHGLWNAEMVVMIGSEKAELFATAHEDKDMIGTEADGHTKLEHKEMDLHNNNVGRKIAEANINLNVDEMADLIYKNIFIETTDFIWLNE